MQLINITETVHENPNTGDRIQRAAIIEFVPIPENEVKSGSSSVATESPIVWRVISTHDRGDYDYDKTRMLAIKSLSSKTVRRTRPKTKADVAKSSWSSNSSSSSFDFSHSSANESEGEEGREGEKSKDNLKYEEHECGPFDLGSKEVPKGVRFGSKAQRELDMLRAVQGHPNVIEFLGFTKAPVPQSVFHNQGNPDLSGSTLATQTPTEALYVGEIAPFRDPFRTHKIIEDFSSQDELEEFEEDVDGEDSSRFLHRRPQTRTRNAGRHRNLHDGQSVERQQGYSNSGVSDWRQSPSPPPTLRSYLRYTSCQPRIGCLIFPWIPLTLQDLIQGGWSCTRPLLIRRCMKQILEGLSWIHDHAGIMHRDISAGNILVDFVGPSEIACVITDFGCATRMISRGNEVQSTVSVATVSPSTSEGSTLTESIAVKEQGRDQDNGSLLTFEIGTRAYRAPELLFSSRTYTNTVDLWSAGVLFAELYLGRRLFSAESDIGQVCSIVKVLDTPTAENWPEFPTLPDYGKLSFQAAECTPLRDLLGLVEKDNHNSLNANNCEQGEILSDLPKLSLATFKALEILEHLITYSGGRRMQASQMLDQYASFFAATTEADLKKETGVGQSETERKPESVLRLDDVLQEKERRRRLEDEEWMDNDHIPARNDGITSDFFQRRGGLFESGRYGIVSDEEDEDDDGFEGYEPSFNFQQSLAELTARRRGSSGLFGPHVGGGPLSYDESEGLDRRYNSGPLMIDNQDTDTESL